MIMHISSLPTALIFIADCRLTANCFPTGLVQTSQKIRLFCKNPVGNCQLLLPTCQLATTQAPQGFDAVGKSARFPLLLRSNAELHPSGVESSALPTPPKKPSRKKKGNHNGKLPLPPRQCCRTITQK